MAFKQCFDATEVLRPKCDMNPYPVQDLVARDLVLLKVYVTRFKLKQARADKKPAVWIDWHAQLELHSISVLGKSTPSNDTEESDMYI
jgi:hypothetical protein